jgi:hypothetical protein
LDVDKDKRLDTEQVPENVHTIFELALPFAIPVPDGLYELYEKEKRIELLIRRIQKDTGFSTSSNGYVQMENDKYGRSAFSRICVDFPRKIDLMETGRTPIVLGNIPLPPRKKSKEILIDLLNRFIEVVKYSTDTYWVEQVRYQDLMFYQAYYWDGKKRYPGVVSLLDTGTGGMKFGLGNPFSLDPQKLEKLKTLLSTTTNLDSSCMLLLSAKSACLEENHRLAVIEAVAGLEVVLYDFIHLKAKEAHLKKEDVTEFIRQIGLYGNITVVLKLLTNGLEQVSDDILKECTNAIHVRNSIMHKGLLIVDATIAEKRILAIEKMIEYLKRVTSAIAQAQ